MFDINKALIPYPHELEDCGGKKLIAIESKPDYKLIIDEYPSEVFGEAVAIIKNKLNALAVAVDDSNSESAYPIYFKVCQCSENKPESYKINIMEDKAVISGCDAGGAFYAAVTFAKLVFSENGKIYLPLCRIVDYPDFKDRGLFLENRFGSDFMSLDEYKDAVDYLADMKYNELTIGLYGCWCVQYDRIISEYQYIPLEKYPELKTPRSIKYYSVNQRQWIYKKDVLPRMFEDDFFGELIAYGKRKNIKIKPLFNSLGHNTLIPRVFPEVSAKDDNNNDTGKGFCTRNDKTYEIMFDIYDEIIDRYLAPHGIDAIEIGLDEVSHDDFCCCDKCKDIPQSELMVEYIINVLKHLKAKGMKSVYIYHDMLFRFGTDGIINEKLAQRFKNEGVYDIAVIDWWSYTTEENLFERKPLSSAFRGITKPFTGYYHWVIPMEYNNDIYGCAKLAKKYGFEGIESYSGFDYCYDRTFKYQAELSWNISSVEKPYSDVDEYYSRYAYEFCPDNYAAAKQALDCMRNIMTADTSACHMNTFEYYWFTYPRGDQPYPRNFPGGLFSTILGNRDMYMEYFSMVKCNASEAIKFFKHNYESKSFINNVWLANAMHYYTYADEYETIVKLYEAKAGKNEVISEIKRLLSQQEAFMSQVENTRIISNQYIYMRNHSITRQFLIDLINYYETSVNPVLEIENFKYIESSVYDFLR